MPNYRDRVLALLQLYKPEAIDKADSLLSRNQGKEEELIQGLVKKFGPEPACAQH
eukprot:gene10937-19580_t